VFTLEVEQTMRLDVRMELGELTETVNVTESGADAQHRNLGSG